MNSVFRTSSDITPMSLFPNEDEEKGYSTMNHEAKKIFTVFFKNVKNQVELNSIDAHKTLGELLLNIQKWMKNENIDAPYFQITVDQIYTFLNHPKENSRMVGRLSSRYEAIIALLKL